MGLKMKTVLRNIVSMALVLALFATSFAGISKAQEINSEEEKLVQEVAAQLKFVVEEAAIKDKHGRVVDIDIDMIENKYGKTEELEQLRQEIQRVNTPPGYEDPFKQETEAVDNCIERKLIGVTISKKENCTFRHNLDTNQPIPCTLRNRLFNLSFFYRVFLS
ncbi:hypothetical protein QYM23_31220 [Bacillus cereus]|uniref:Uncharacterized protein n=1 Tax=Bacillus cereus TaxID=1396 RepID=A0AAW7NQI7_BACCE|nr:hypothetical protein [Bacillus cereus]MDN4877254.1 hypothetical protein [Bacillus cereus]